MEQTNDYKIWYPYEVFYIESMLTITRTAMFDQSVLRDMMKKDITNEKEFNDHLVVDSVQNIITHAAAISRYFWPVKQNEVHGKRGQRLREALNIAESNPLKNRDIRNFIEHFDENLDLYLQKGIAGRIIPIYVGKRPHNDNNINHFFRAFFTDDGTFHALGKEYNVIEIINELIRIHICLERFAENGGRLPK